MNLPSDCLVSKICTHRVDKQIASHPCNGSAQSCEKLLPLCHMYWVHTQHDAKHRGTEGSGHVTTWCGGLMNCGSGRIRFDVRKLSSLISLLRFSWQTRSSPSLDCSERKSREGLKSGAVLQVLLALPEFPLQCIFDPMQPKLMSRDKNSGLAEQLQSSLQALIKYVGLSRGTYG